MVVDYLKDVKPFEDEGMTDAETAAHLSNRTQNPIPCGEAKILLEETGLVIEDPVTLQRSGTLVTRYQAMPNNAMKTLLGWFIAHVFGRGEQISSHQNPRAVQLAAVLASLPAELQSVGVSLLQLGGGQPQAGTTEQDVTNSRTNYQTHLTRIAAFNALSARADLAKTAAQAALTQELTPAEITSAGENAFAA